MYGGVFGDTTGATAPLLANISESFKLCVSIFYVIGMTGVERAC